jgi:MYXO-CTERM domain-containing protein
MSVHGSARFAAIAATLVYPIGAAAAPCGRADLLHAFPPDEATNVPIDATLSAHYARSAEYLGEPVPFGTEGAPVPVAVDFDSTQALLSYTPGGSLLPNTRFEIQWPPLHGLNSATVGSAFKVHFTTGASVDGAPPEFDGLTRISFDVSHARDECTDSVEDRYRFRLGLSDASDDGGRDALALLVFQTSGPNIPEGSPEPVLLTPLPESNAIALDRAVPDAVGRICFAAIVKDLTGKISSSGDREVCIQVAEPPVFFGCSAGGGRTGTGVWAALGAGLLILVRRRRGAATSHAR